MDLQGHTCADLLPLTDLPQSEKKAQGRYPVWGKLCPNGYLCLAEGINVDCDSLHGDRHRTYSICGNILLELGLSTRDDADVLLVILSS